MNTTIYAADLFAGAGGGTSALVKAAAALGLDAQVVAVNHWQTAVDTHAKNHPGHIHYCDPVEAVEPAQAVPGGKLDMLIAGPSCVHFSRARGEKPKDDQQRAGAWQVFKWAEDLNPEVVLVENVPDFLTWGPLDAAGRPTKDGLGAEFLRWVGALKKLGYNVEWRILCAADYGDPTTRKRLFIQATRGAIRWPMPSHYDPKIAHAFPERKPWRAAQKIIDFSIPSQSIFGRKKPLVEATVARIHAGVCKFWGEEFGYDLDTPGPHPWKDRPIPLTPRRILKLSEMGWLPPFLNKFHGGEHGASRTLPVSSPMATLDGSNRFGLAQPFLVKFYGGHNADSIGQPIGTLTASYEHYGLAQGFLVGVGGPRSLHREISLGVPLRSQLGQNHLALVQPLLLSIDNASNSGTPTTLHSPVSTIVSKARHCVVEPFLISYYGNGSECSLSSPMPTATGRDRFALVWPVVADAIDIHLRMLDPQELKLAHSFPSEYEFCGSRADQVKQIGNSWPVGMGEALCKAILQEIGGAS